MTKTDCIFYDEKKIRNGCTALTECFCQFEDRCAFYKSIDDYTWKSNDRNDGVRQRKIARRNGGDRNG